ncbi:MAG TPA: hypothetical protein VK401_11260 [Propionibacteriaceae bacterium]|jgi:hypothetical protein|nr:hypothetical protein [Propionibacteriaceae bacterium]
MTTLVFVPVDRETADALRTGTDPGPRPGCAPTAELAASTGPDAVAEEVEFAALSHAGVLALTSTTDPLRLVLAADVEAVQVEESGDGLGQVVVAGLRWPQVQSLFADEPDAAAAVAAARAAAEGRTLTEALELDEVAQLLDAYDLLWFAPEELEHS